MCVTTLKTSVAFCFIEKYLLLQRAWCTLVAKLLLPKSSTLVDALVYILTEPVPMIHLSNAVQLFSTWPDLIPFLGEYFTFQKIQIHLVDVGIFVLVFVLFWTENSKVTVFFICIFTSKISFCPCSIYNCLRRMIYFKDTWVQNDSCSNNYQKVSWWLSHYLKEFH